VVGCARSRATLDTVLELNLADTVTDDPSAAAEGADLVMICTPIGAYRAIGERIGPALAPGATVSDVGSVKRAVISALQPVLPAGVQLVPGHPIAGTENSGPEAGFETLFEGRWVILTPPPGTDEAAVERVAELWRRCGSFIERMDPDHHDQVLAITSH